jgi:predicted DNA-binding protein (UPF0251 family)
MPRPCKQRKVICTSQVSSFIPYGNTAEELETIALTLDELEAIRLADLEGLYQERAANEMQISRQTFGNIISSAHRKIADFLLNKKKLSIGGGQIKLDTCGFFCGKCNYRWFVQCETEKPSECPQCKGTEFFCVKKSDKGQNIKCWRIV